MNTNEPVIRRWNLFARELEDVLTNHSLRLGQLDDRAGIHREKVRRLQKSLRVPKSFPTLNPGEMDKVIEMCFLTDDEVFRLRAAIIATSVEAMLMDRINQDDALKATEQILPVIEAALRSYADETTGIGAFKRGEATMIDDTDTTIDLALETALDTIDRATIALHLSHNVSSARERLERAHQARDGFAVALVELNEANAAIKTTEAWRDWYEETQSSYQAASDRVVDLGG